MKHRVALHARLAALLVVASVSLAHASPSDTDRAIDVVHYTAHIEPDLSAKTLTGRVTIELRTLVANRATIEFDCGGLAIDAVREAGQALAYSRRDRRLVIHLPRPSRRGERRRFQIDYRGAPKYGLEFHPERAQLYTVFSTSQWLPAIDAPGERATIDLSLVVPAAWKAIGSGALVSQRALDDHRRLWHWRQARAMPSYTFGFAAGEFTEATLRGRPDLRHLGSGFSADELRRVFADTGPMLRFFAHKAGVLYGGATYTQALVARTIGQELDGFSLLSEAYGRDVLADPRAEGLIAHEAAHQWWGNRITCAGWDHFWLNEGFATFMTAAYLEHRFGRDLYLQQVQGWQARLERLRRDGKDKPLVFPDWDHPTNDDRAVVYQKGAYVLHLLRERMGEAAFWKGLRAYSRAHMDRSVVTRDFQSAMQRASGDDLSPFFNEWAYPN